MLKNYFKTAFRNLFKYKFYTLINVFGLSIGIAAMVWGFQNYRYSFGFDDFHPDTEHVYRGLTFRQGSDGIQGVFPMPAVKDIENNLPGISAVARLHKAPVNIKNGKDETFSEWVSFTDPSFFQLFNFPLLSGKNDLNDPGAALITENIAKKYFGDEDPIGRSLLFYSGEKISFPLTIRGVLKNPPMNSTIQFTFLTRFENLEMADGKKIKNDDWSLLLNSAAYFKIPNPADLPKIEEGLKRYLPLQNKSREDWKVSGFKMITVKQNAALCNIVRSSYLFQRPTDAAAYGPFICAILILLCVCLNFSNTTVARFSGRLKEIGMRKVMGGTQAQLSWQMLIECAVIVLLGILLSCAINNWWLPAFNRMFVYVDVEAHYFRDSTLLAFLSLLFIITVLLAGAYPAFYISKFNPSSIFRGAVKFGGSNLFSRIMLGLQISISLIAVIGGASFAINAEFEKTYDFGYAIHNNIGVSVKDKNHFSALKHELSKIPQITDMAWTKDNIGYSRRHEVSEAEGNKKETMMFEVGPHYLQLMHMKIAAGRGFSDSLQGDFTHSLLVTEKYAGLFGWTPLSAIGKQVKIDTNRYSIVGVLRDFHPVTLFEPAEAVVIKLSKEEQVGALVISGHAGDLKTIYNSAQRIWRSLFPAEPFDGFYQDDLLAHSYDTSASIASIFSGLAALTALLSAAGLFALISLTLLKRMREIALRKVVGAKKRDIFLLINRGYFWVVIAGTILGIYGGMSLTGALLNQIFVVNAGIRISTILFSALLVIGIAVFTTGIRIWQTVRTKSVDLLRRE